MIELEPGRTADEYEWEENEDGSTTITCGRHKVTFRCEGGRRPNLCEVPSDDPEVPTIPRCLSIPSSRRIRWTRRSLSSP